MYTIIFGIIIFIIAAILVTVVMVQNPKEGGLSAAFGGGQQHMGGVKRSGDILERATWILAASLIILSMTFNIMSSGKNTSPSSELDPVTTQSAQ